MAAIPAEEVLRVTWAEERNLWFVGLAGAECSAGLWQSSDQGAGWVGPGSTANAWYLDPDPLSPVLQAPNGPVSSPCGGALTIDLEPTSFDEAFVLCGAGDVFRTTNAGAGWEAAGLAAGAAALGVVDGAPLVAVLGAGDCDGVAVGPPEGEARTCVEGAAGTEVSMSFAGPGAGFLIAAGTTYVSNDGGATWRQV